MSGMSDRDQKIILVLLTAMIICLPYFFFIKDKKIETESIKSENVSLQERLDYLKQLDLERDRYLKETEAMNKQRDEIIASFPADVRPENYTMFLLETEYSTATKDEETGLYEMEYPLAFDSVNYGANIISPISSEDADTGFNAISNTSSLTYRCYYDGIKYLLQYLMDYKDPMAYRNISVEFDPATGICSGSIQLVQYAVSGSDRTLPAAVIEPDLDKMDLRGNEEVGVFGPVDKVPGEDEDVEETEEVLDDTEVTEE